MIVLRAGLYGISCSAAKECARPLSYSAVERPFNSGRAPLTRAASRHLLPKPACYFLSSPNFSRNSDVKIMKEGGKQVPSGGSQPTEAIAEASGKPRMSERWPIGYQWVL